MVKNDPALMVFADLPLALTLLSRLPLRIEVDGERQAHAAWAYPVVGLILGALAALTGLIGAALGLPTPIAALLVLAASLALTGAMHEDGLADTFDGLWGGWDKERRLEIMKDSHIGTYGVAALILSLAARWAAIWMLLDVSAATLLTGLMASGAASRATMPVLMASLQHARQTGLSQSVGAVPSGTAGLAVGISVISALLLLGFGAVWPLFACLIAAFIIARIAIAKIGGQTGDILGASQQLAEIAFLCALL